ncbi:hypothetical protein GCM10011575_39810 [Microlunatus endophyticus]|uniref:Uncharacterized protein n=1 Tax=Microlunatus endophyticus TaxID=1716077 RepID=A0A917SEW2_9ACTN|nr:hypothetical protein GCM10011575_39810 [Microlunatus endophyticus]
MAPADRFAVRIDQDPVRLTLADQFPYAAASRLRISSRCGKCFWERSGAPRLRARCSALPGSGEVRVVVLVVAEALVQKAAARVLSGAFQTIDPILSMAPVWLR